MVKFGNKLYKMLMVCAVVGFLLFSGTFTMLTPTQTIEVQEGTTVQIPFKFVHDDGDFFGTSCQYRVLADYKGYSHDDEVLWKQVLTVNQVVDTAVDWKVQGVAGDTYDLEIDAEAYTGSWTSASYNDYTLHVVVVGEPVEETVEQQIEEPIDLSPEDAVAGEDGNDDSILGNLGDIDLSDLSLDDLGFGDGDSSGSNVVSVVASIVCLAVAGLLFVRK